MTKKEKFGFLIEYFSKHNPDAETELAYSNPYELLVAVILSAQCTDKRINMVTPALFHDFPTVQHLATATAEDILPFIRSISYPNNKAKHLAGMSRMVVDKFNGQIPSTIDELTQLPGVGRKTANVIASVVFMQPALAVDTHVFRVSARIGLTKDATTPLATEKQLMKYIPEQLVAIFHHWLILHGRYICIARTPKCEACPLTSACSFHKKNFGKKTTKSVRPSIN